MKRFRISEERVRKFCHDWDFDAKMYADLMELIEKHKVEYQTLKKYYRVYGKDRYGNLKVFIDGVCIHDKDEYYHDNAIMAILCEHIYYKDNKAE